MLLYKCLYYEFDFKNIYENDFDWKPRILQCYFLQPCVEGRLESAYISSPNLGLYCEHKDSESKQGRD